MQEVAPSRGIAWLPVGSLIAINASLIISWIAYHNYQPKLLERFDYGEYATFLGWAKLIVLAVVPPLAGYIADRIRPQRMYQIPLLSAGVCLTALIFFVVGMMITPSPLLPWAAILPLMMVLWLISMNVFYAPALAALERLVSKESLGIVVAVYALVADILYGLEPLIVDLVQFFGAAPTFFLGGVLVLGSGLFFQRNYGQAVLVNPPENKSSNFGLVLMMGLCLGVASGYIINRLPFVLPNELYVAGFTLGGELWVSKIFILAALLAIPAARWAKQRNQLRIFGLSFFVALALLFLLGVVPEFWAIPVSMILSACLASMSVTALPLAFGSINSARMAMGMGVFLCGLELPDSLMELFY
jgi:MFS family permease